MTDGGQRESPARRPAVLGREVVERVLLNLWTLPSRVDRAPITKALDEAMKSLDGLQASELEDAAHLDKVRDAVAKVEEARSRLEAAGAGPAGERLLKSVGDLGKALAASLDLTMERLIELQGLFLRRPPVQAAPTLELLPFRASEGLPVVHTLDRKPLPLGIRVDAAEDDDEPDELDDADADGDIDLNEIDRNEKDNAGIEAILNPRALGAPGETKPPEADAGLHPALKAELEGLRRVARDCMEELGSLGLLRAPEGPRVAWVPGPADFEQRLLNCLDALIALGHPFQSAGGEGRFDVLAALLEYAGDSFVPDPARGFARAFVLGCVAGEDTVRAAVIGLRQSHRMTYLAQRDALALAPSPGIGQAMRKLAQSGGSALVRVALDVLRLRWEGTFEVAAPFIAHPEASVRSAAARCLSVAQAREPAIRLLERRLDMEDDDRVLAVVAEGLLRLDAPSGLATARDRLVEELSSPGSLSPAARIDFARLVGIAGGASDAELLLRLLEQSPQEASAAGAHGHPALVPALINALQKSEGIAARASYLQAAARALHRITGLGLLDVEPKPAIEAGEPVAESSFWYSRWSAAQKRFEAIQKYRYGKPYSPLATVSEAEADEVTTDRRGDCELELAIVSGGTSRLQVRDWVARQKAELRVMRERFAAAERGGYEPGLFPAARLGRLAGVYS